jgi:hypothetical protein
LFINDLAWRYLAVFIYNSCNNDSAIAFVLFVGNFSTENLGAMEILKLLPGFLCQLGSVWLVL